MGNEGIIILGSSRSVGNTGLVVSELNRELEWNVVDLSQKEIGSFDYEFKNSGDDFLPLVRNVVDNYQTIVFATPVYWYSMSGIMKNFFDRLSDLLKIDKPTGRKLRGKNMAMISCGSDANVPDYFRGPFVDSADYLGMNYLGDVHTWVSGDTVPKPVCVALSEFSRKLTATQK